VDKILYYTKIELLLNSATNSGNREKLAKVSGLYATGQLLSISGPICRCDDSFAHNFDYTPIPVDFNTSMSFGEVALDAAENLWRQAGDKKIALFWSGGIDSTTALVALMMTNTNWSKQLIIYTSDYSVNVEYKLFYESFIHGKVETIFLSDRQFFNPELYGDDRLVVDGTCGDQIWGCNILRKMMDKIHQPYQVLYNTDVFDKAVKMNMPLSSRTQAIKYIDNLVDKFPVKIKTLAELFWLLTFTHKWDVVKLRHTSYIADVTKFGKMISFFNTDNFQRWAMSNPDKKLQNEWNTYKQPAKDFIYELTKDNDYRINKLQHESLGRSMQNDRPNYYVSLVTNNGYQLHENKDVINYINLLNGCLK